MRTIRCHPDADRALRCRAFRPLVGAIGPPPRPPTPFVSRRPKEEHGEGGLDDLGVTTRRRRE
ncbi:hypothetical protein, partial [Halogeometricum sp. CBA1124]|uniref:hypothetical protein n=1 Tax=Halogeometricum sp. CBA1124 TaxID=2668071 RepID=UPI001E3EAA71